MSVQALTIDEDSNEQNKGHKFYSYGRCGVSFDRCNYAWFRNLRVTKIEQYSFLIQGFRDSLSYHVFFEVVQSDINKLYGMKFRGFLYGNVVNSIIRDNGRNGICATGRSGKILIYNDRIWNSGKCGYASESDKRNVLQEIELRKIIVEKSKKGDICVLRGLNTVIDSSTALNSAECCMIETKKTNNPEKFKMKGKPNSRLLRTSYC